VSEVEQSRKTIAADAVTIAELRAELALAKKLGISDGSLERKYEEQIAVIENTVARQNKIIDEREQQIADYRKEIDSLREEIHRLRNGVVLKVVIAVGVALGLGYYAGQQN
jgi:uncharacterized coiled-coil protein SlyX